MAIFRAFNSNQLGLTASILFALAPAYSQAISNESNSLYQEWENLQVNHYQSNAAHVGERPANGLRSFLIPEAGIACHNYSLSLENELNVPDTVRFSDLSGICVADLERVNAGIFSVTVSNASTLVFFDSPQAQASASLVITDNSKELFLALPTRNADAPDDVQDLILESWPESAKGAVQKASWWRRAFSWIPGISATKRDNNAIAFARPQWLWQQNQCTDSSLKAEAASSFFGLLHTSPVEDMSPTELSIASDCAVLWGWADTARALIQQWNALDQPGNKLASSQLALADLDYRTGNYQAIIDGLEVKDFDAIQHTKALHSRSMAFIAMERYSDAIKLLSKGRHLATHPDTAALESNNDPSLFMRYNLATSLMKEGRQDEGLAVLDSLGSHPSTTPFSAALIERANLALGWQFVKQGNGGSAAPVFERILLDGPFARRAALGLGWSWALSPGERQKRVVEPTHKSYAGQSAVILKALYQHQKISCQEYREALNDDNACKRSQYFSQVSVESEEQRSANAINVWAYLLEKDLSDLASIETSVQLAKALRLQGKTEPATRLLSQAIYSIREQRSTLDRWQSRKDSPSGQTQQLATPRELSIWWFNAEPTLLKSTLIDMEAQALILGGRNSSQWSEVNYSIQNQLGSLVDSRADEYRDKLESYLAEAYLIRGQIFEHTQHGLLNEPLAPAGASKSTLEVSYTK